MSSEFYISGKKYISARRASKLTGYASDYIGQLCRTGKLDSQIIGRSWFVAEESLLGYKRSVVDDVFATSKLRQKRNQKRGRQAQKNARPTTSATPSTTGAHAPTAPSGLGLVAGARIVRAAGRRSRGRLSRRGKPRTSVPSVTAIIERPVMAVGEPVRRAVLPVAASAPMYARHDVVRAAGNLFLSAAVGFTMFMLVLSAGPVYRSTEIGARQVGVVVDDAINGAEAAIANAPTYLDAGIVAIGTVVGEGTQAASAGSSVSLSSVASSILGKFNSLAVSFYRSVNSVFVRAPKVDVQVRELATHAADMPANPNGIVIVPSTGDAEENAKIENYIRNSFSDEVVIEHEEDGTGVIKPVFKSGKEDEYIYVLVPIGEGG